MYLCMSKCICICECGVCMYLCVCIIGVCTYMCVFVFYVFSPAQHFEMTLCGVVHTSSFGVGLRGDVEDKKRTKMRPAVTLLLFGHPR